jgi:hypothetical protein
MARPELNIEWNFEISKFAIQKTAYCPLPTAYSSLGRRRRRESPLRAADFGKARRWRQPVALGTETLGTWTTSPQVVAKNDSPSPSLDLRAASCWRARKRPAPRASALHRVRIAAVAHAPTNCCRKQVAT